MLTADRCSTGVPLAPLTTLGVGGPAARLVAPTSARDLAEVVLDLDAASEPVLVLGGGSNVVVSDLGFPGTVALAASRGVEVVPDGGDALVRVAAGEVWDDVVVSSLDAGLAGLEALSGIPGSAGATPVQNVGAYGAEVADTLVSVSVLDRLTRTVRTLSRYECGFSYRSSVFRSSSRFVVLELVFRLERTPLAAPVRYPELAATLGVPLDARPPASEVRRSVLALRRSKGMVLDPSDPDSRSAGSFFKNPVLDLEAAALLPSSAPRWPVTGGVKTSAAHLLELSGFSRGSSLGPAALSSKHPLALVNLGGASAADVLALARFVRSGVQDATGVLLEVEPVLVGLEL